MALKKLLWRKYLFIGRTEGETEQLYWDEKRKKHLASEHAAGIASGLEITATAPPSLRVEASAGRAVDSDGNDPELESLQELDLTSSVPGSGTATVYVALSFVQAEVEPYFVDEIGGYQNKYVQDGVNLEVLTSPPSTPAIELARIELAAGATEITDPVDPEYPGTNEIDMTHRQTTAQTVISLADLADVVPEEAAAFNNMNGPSAGNPIATLDDVVAGVAPVEAELAAARGTAGSLDGRLDVTLDEDGSLKAHAASHGDGGSDAIDAATPAAAGLMPAADKAKLDGVEAGAVAAGAAGDAHAMVASGNPHSVDAVDVGAAPASHVGGGGAAHALVVSGGDAGFMSGTDKAKLDTVAPGSGGGWTPLTPAGGALATQVAGHSPGQRFWLEPGRYPMGGTVTLEAGAVVAGTREAIVELSAADQYFDLAHDGAKLLGITAELRFTGAPQAVLVSGSDCEVDGLAVVTRLPSERAVAGIYVAYGNRSFIRNCRLEGCASWAAVKIGETLGGCTVENNQISLGDETDTSFVAAIRHEDGVASRNVLVHGNSVELGQSDLRVAFMPGAHWRVIANRVYSSGAAYEDYGVVCETSGVSYVLVQGNRFEHQIEYGIDASASATQWLIDGNFFQMHGGGKGINLYGSGTSHVRISNNAMQFNTGGGTGIEIYAATILQYLVITGNDISSIGTGLTGIYLHNAGTYTVESATITGNNVSSFTRGIYLNGSCRNATLSANVVRFCSTECIAIDMQAGGDASVVIQGNWTYGSGTSTKGIYVNGDRTVISGNMCEGNQSATQAIHLSNDSGLCCVVGNVARGIDQGTGSGHVVNNNVLTG